VEHPPKEDEEFSRSSTSRSKWPGLHGRLMRGAAPGVRSGSQRKLARARWTLAGELMGICVDVPFSQLLAVGEGR
jgi:hypothetical protein